MQFESIEYKLPAHWLAPFVNHDYTGLSDEENAQFCEFCRDEIGVARKHGRRYIGIEYADESYFAASHDGVPYGCLPCDVVDCVITFSY